MSDGRHPSELGWRNPKHVIGHGFGSLLGMVQVAVAADGRRSTIRAEPGDDATPVADFALVAGERFAVIGVHAGEVATIGTSALAYDIWYRLRLASGEDGWLRSMVSDDRNTGSDGLPTAIRPILLPVTGNL